VYRQITVLLPSRLIEYTSFALEFSSFFEKEERPNEKNISNRITMLGAVGAANAGVYA
jgi:hypothetical protein